MDAGVTGAIIGVSVMGCVALSTVIHDCWKKRRARQTPSESVHLLKNRHTSMRDLFIREILPPSSQPIGTPVLPGVKSDIVSV